ncbi:SGNH/GDSL hydrolase family protein [Polaribacter sp. Q13]|uniref:SGNH/GDSL hydrolase family protein n=1 Tax=Polaribacter sp. Q13 TaxID=2806551 RepID=UPI00193BFA9D|nr:SGNH/GDSL hydrolase family protein [Polaribacter sp. Q13]QVY66047.1 electron transporter RnfD [Polaribacter sp. Q13]
MQSSIKYVFILFLVISCKSIKLLEVSKINYNDKSIVFEGRIGENPKEKAKEIYWSGSSIKLNFKGTALKVVLNDENGVNYFNVILDGKPIDVLKLKKGLSTYTLAENLENKAHSIELTKRNEWTYGTTWFYGFELNGTVLAPDNPKKLFIEFYGDSITVGHGNEDYDSGQDRNDGNVTNNYNSYAAITARNLNASYACIARSGIGVTVSWFNMIMPEMYDRLNPNDSESKWDFSKKQPDIVVVNLFQNDSWILNRPKHEEFKRRFGNKKPTEKEIIAAYSNFIKSIRTHYANASIVCLLGDMDITKENSPWPNYVTKAVNDLGDKKVYTCFVPYKQTKKHPRVKDHNVMANQLITFIKSSILVK